MKFVFIESNENVVKVYAKERNALIDAIESMCNIDDNILGYYEDSIVELNLNKVECFYTQKDRVCAISDNKVYYVKKRLYELYELAKDSFVYINQGCLANINKIAKFDVSIGGTLMVVFHSGYKDYVARRRLKEIKERMGIK